jgi:hypothetical protein
MIRKFLKIPAFRLPGLQARGQVQSPVKKQ